MERVAGTQLDSQELYERQKQLRAYGEILPGPTVVAVGLTVPENLGMALRLADGAGVSRVFFVGDESPNLARLRKTARRANTLVLWEICSVEKFLDEIVSSLPPLVAIELITRSTNIFETPLPAECTFVVGSEQHGILKSVLFLNAGRTCPPLEQKGGLVRAAF